MNSLNKAVMDQVSFGDKKVKNRLAVAPMTRVSADQNGVPTDVMRRYYRRFAEGGFGLIITEGLFIDEEYSQGYRFQPGIASQEQSDGWKKITDDLHEKGSLVFAQLMHAGALSQENPHKDHNIAPTSIEPKGQQMVFYYGEGGYAVPQEITAAQIENVIKAFADSADRAIEEANFDGIEIHGANGYLLDSFLTADLNRRDDKWGGDTAGRVSLLGEIVKTIKERVGEGIPVGIRISQSKVNDYESKWPNGERDAEVIFSLLAKAGADFIHVTERDALRPAFANNETPLFELAARYAPGTTIIANGSLGTSEAALSAIGRGADIVALGRSALSNPDMPKIFAEGGTPRPFDGRVLGPIANIKDSETVSPT